MGSVSKDIYERGFLAIFKYIINNLIVQISNLDFSFTSSS